MHKVMSTGSDVLDKIMTHKAGEVEHAKRQVALADLKARSADSDVCRGFVAGIKESLDQGDSGGF